MKFKRSLRKAKGAFVILSLAFCGLGFAQPFKIGDHFWPTPNRAFLDSKSLGTFLQPTSSGRLESALFGCVRTNGRQFHEGIDLKPIQHDRRGESIDDIYAFHEGIVRYVNRKAGKSSYGQYVVIEHPDIQPGLVSLYAHLRSVPRSISPGRRVAGGEKIGIMGRSAGGYTIPRERAHLHFEIGYWLGPEFQKWFDQQPFKSPNDHGAWNGMNIVGIDVWDFWQAMKRGTVHNLEEHLAREPVAVTATIPRTSIPDILQANPDLMTNIALPQKIGGWRVELTWYGMPLRFTALSREEMKGNPRVQVEVDHSLHAKGDTCIALARTGAYSGPSGKLNTLISRLFVD